MSTVVLTETWTGSDSSAWGANWRSITADSGNNTTDIQGNRGRMQGVNGVHFFAWADTADVANVRVEFEFEPTNTGTGSGYNFVHIRSGDDSDTNGYRLMLQAFSGTPAGQILLDRRDGGSSTNLSTVGYSLNSSTVYAVIFEAIGTTIRYKVWVPASESEPAAWTASVTDSTHTTGAIGLHYRSNDSTTRTTWWDNLTITDLDPAGLLVASGSFTGNATARTIDIGWGDIMPKIVLLKNGDSATSDSRNPVIRFANMPAGESKRLLNEVRITTGITGEGAGTFAVGTHGSANGSGDTIQWLALAGDDVSLVSYVGNGNTTTGQSATGAGFEPDMVWVPLSAAGAKGLVIKTDNMAANESRAFTSQSGSVDFHATTPLNSDGFTVRHDAAGGSINTNAVTYYAACFRRVTGSIDIGTYTGTGGTLSITAPGFQTEHVGVLVAGNAAGVWKSTSHPTNTSSPVSTVADLTNAITALTSTGFDLDTNSAVNGGGTDYYYWALATTPAATAGHGLLLAMRRNRLVRTG